MLGIMSQWESLLIFFYKWSSWQERCVSCKEDREMEGEEEYVFFFFAFSNKGDSLWLLSSL